MRFIVLYYVNWCVKKLNALSFAIITEEYTSSKRVGRNNFTIFISTYYFDICLYFDNIYEYRYVIIVGVRPKKIPRSKLTISLYIIICFMSDTTISSCSISIHRYNTTTSICARTHAHIKICAFLLYSSLYFLFRLHTRIYESYRKVVLFQINSNKKKAKLFSTKIKLQVYFESFWYLTDYAKQKYEKYKKKEIFMTFYYNLNRQHHSILWSTLIITYLILRLIFTIVFELQLMVFWN